MAQVKVAVTDDEGKAIGIHDYDLTSGLKILSQMENAIENLRPQMLRDINRNLLEEEQRVLKKTVFTARGKYSIKIKKQNSRLAFLVNRYETAVGMSKRNELVKARFVEFSHCHGTL